jgi:hypothetical protein
MQSSHAEIDYLQMLLAMYVEHEDKVVARLILQIRQTLEGMKACAS